MVEVVGRGASAKGHGEESTASSKVNPTMDLPGIESRPYQHEAWARLREARTAGEPAALIHMATGLGKTTVAAGDVAQFIAERAVAGLPPPRILFMAHQRELLVQAQEQFRRLLPELNYSAFGGQNSRRRRTAKVEFSTLQAMSHTARTFDPTHFDYIVVDESHHGAAPHFNRVIRHFRPQFLLGITATPFRSDEVDLTETFGRLVYSMSLVDAIAAGWLLSPDYRLYRDEVVDDLIGQDFTDVRSLNHALFAPARNDEIAALVMDTQEAISGTARTIVFARSIEHAEDFVEYLPIARVLHSGLPRGEQRHVIAGFRAGRIPAVVTVDMFNEGVDVPEANLIVFLRSTASRTVFEQQLGRGLRRSPGKSGVIIMDFIGTSERLYELYRLKQAVAGSARRLRSESGSVATVQEFGVHFTRDDLRIIERLHGLQTVLPAPPSEYRHLTELASELGHGPKAIIDVCAELEIALVLMRRRQGGAGYFFSPAQVQQIADAFPPVDAATAGAVSLRAVSHTTGMGVALLRSAMAELGITGTRRRAAGVADGALTLTVEEQQRIAAHVVVAPPGSLSLNQLRQQGGLTLARLKTALNDLAIVPTTAYDPETHARGLFVSAKDANTVLASLDSAPGLLSSDMIAQKMGVSLAVVDRAIKAADVAGTTSRPPGQGRARRMFTPTEQRAVIDTIGVAPQDWISVSDLAVRLGLPETTLRARAARRGIKFPRYLNPRRNVREQFASPEQQAQLEA